MVCLSVFYVVHWAQTAEDIDTISLAYDSPVSLPGRVKIWLTLVNPFIPKFCFKATRLSVDLRVGDVRWQIAAKWLDSAMVTMNSIWETTIALSNSTVAVLQRPLLPTKLDPKCTPGLTSRRVLPPGEYGRTLLTRLLLHSALLAE